MQRIICTVDVLADADKTALFSLSLSVKDSSLGAKANSSCGLDPVEHVSSSMRPWVHLQSCQSLAGMLVFPQTTNKSGRKQTRRKRICSILFILLSNAAPPGAGSLCFGLNWLLVVREGKFPAPPSIRWKLRRRRRRVGGLRLDKCLGIIRVAAPCFPRRLPLKVWKFILFCTDINQCRKLANKPTTIENKLNTKRSEN